MAFENTGLHAVITGTGAYVRNATRITSANTGIVKSLSFVQRSSGPAAGGLALLLGAAGAASVKFAADFETSLSKIAGLTDTPKKAIAGIRKEILELSREVAISPEELGAGAYFILSSGITDVATAMRVLTLSSKASVAGLGDVQTIARTTTAVMNAYGLSVDQADKVINTLVGTVRKGAGESDALAGSLGFIIPLAAQMGVEFEQVGAVLATLTNIGLDAENAVTALKGTLSQLLAPTEESIELFGKLGLGTLADFRKEIDENFVGAMTRLFNVIGENDAVVAKLFPDIRGLIGVLGAFGAQGEDTVRILHDLGVDMTFLKQGFEEGADTTNFKLRKAINNLKVDMIGLGTEALPLVVQGLEDLGAAASFLRENLDILIPALVAVGIAFAWAHPLGAVFVGLGLIAGAVLLLRTNNDELSESALMLKIRLLELAEATEPVTKGFFRAIEANVSWIAALEEAGTHIPVIGDAFEDGLAKKIVDGSKRAQDGIGGVSEALVEARATLAQLRTDGVVAELQDLAANAYTTGGAMLFVAGIADAFKKGVDIRTIQAAAFKTAFQPPALTIPSPVIGGGGIDLGDLLGGDAAKEKNPFEEFITAEKVRELILRVAAEGKVTWADVGQLWELGAHDAAQDFSRFLNGEISNIGEDINNSFVAIAKKWMGSVEAGILDGTLDVLDALDFLENGMIDAARSIVEGLSAKAEDMSEQWQILVDTIKRGTVEIQDVNRLFDLNASDAALDFLRFLSGEPSNVGTAIEKFRRVSRGSAFPGGASFNNGGFVEPGQTVPATLHGGSYGEVIVPLGAPTAMMSFMNNMLRSIGGGSGSSGGFRNYGNISLFGSADSSPVMRAMTRALGV